MCTSADYFTYIEESFDRYWGQPHKCHRGVWIDDHTGETSKNATVGYQCTTSKYAKLVTLNNTATTMNKLPQHPLRDQLDLLEEFASLIEVLVDRTHFLFFILEREIVNIIPGSTCPVAEFWYNLHSSHKMKLKVHWQWVSGRSRSLIEYT